MNNVRDIKYMQRALDLAARAQGRTSPNPMVGAVVVKGDEIIGEGYHHKAGTAHAEVIALNAAGEDARGATLYVTLEPCSHYGRTPPCADAVAAAGIKRAVIACLDPNPLVSGKGLKIMEEAGIETINGVLQEPAERLNEAFFKYIRFKTPFIILKVAMTLDGKIATGAGDSRWISSEASRHYVHQLRNTCDAIMVGIGTVLKDDPMLNTRLDEPDAKDPVRVIIDSRLDLPLQSKIVRSAKEQRTIVFCHQQADRDKTELLKQNSIEIIPIAGNREKLCLEEAFKALGEIGIMSLLAEGGGEINGYLVEKGLIDKLYCFIAPKLVGGREAPTPVGGEGIPVLNNALPVKSMEITRLEDDILITGYL